MSLAPIFLFALGLLAGTADRAPVFRPLDFESARRVAREQERLLVVDFTASWCMPCKRMEQTTWVDPKVSSWLEKNAVAIQIDIDEHVDLARSLKVGSVPLIVVYKGEDEFDRKGGYQGPSELLAWLKGVEKGERALDALRLHAKGTNVFLRSRLAKALLDGRHFEEALEQYLWLWNRALDHEPSYRAVRLSYWAMEIGTLCRRHSPAREAFGALRDAAYEKWSADLEQNPSAAEDWVALNEELRHRSQSVEWYERVKDDPRWQERLASLQLDVYREYLERGDFAAAGRVYAWPGGLARQFAQARAAALQRAQNDPEAALAARTRYREEISQLYAANLAAGKERQAQQVAAQAFEVDPDPPVLLSLVKAALASRQPRPVHREWLETAEKRGLEARALRQELEEALRNP